ncbi:MAG: YidC/Oxa1 family insertase periplasmic-domain containing protein [Phycisphaeraceae bacterium]
MRTLVLLAVTVFTSLSVLPPALAQDSTPPAVPAKEDAKKTEAAAKDDAPKDAPKDDAKAAPVEPPKTAPQPPVVTTPPVAAVEVPKPPPPFKIKPVTVAGESEIGSLDPTKHMLHVTLSELGAAIGRVETTAYAKEVDSKDPYVVLKELYGTRKGQYGLLERHFSALSITIDGTEIQLWTAWELVSPGVYRTTILDHTDKPVLQITRTYSLGNGVAGYDITCSTQFTNLTEPKRELALVWKQYGLGDVERDADYRGDTRMITPGYFDLAYDPKMLRVYTGEGKVDRPAALENNKPLWPATDSPQQYKLTWLGMSDRYFAGVMHRPVPTAPPGANVRVVAAPFDEVFDRTVGIEVVGDVPLGKVETRVLLTVLKSKEIKLAGGASHTLDLCLYAGPRQGDVLSQHPFSVLGLDEHLVKYDMGCGVCLSQWLAGFLLWFLDFLHNLVFDWGMAIIILVVCVRLLLHPITKKAQINMTKMSKQMAKMQPEMAKIKERYKADPQKQQAEMMKLYREHGVSPMGFLGCLPMFLQMPIWIALYAMLYGAIELRHEHAFWGIFQLFGDWAFLRDLSSPDYFITFAPGGFNIPLCGAHITYSLNLLPLLMGVLFYFQQKLTTPPPANEQQAQQQKIMKWMMLLFPLFFYAAPSGLTLYIMASSIGGMIDGYVVRKHIKAEEEAGTLFKKKEPKPGGFFDRMQKMLEAKQKEMAAKRAEQGGGGKRGGGKKRK